MLTTLELTKLELLQQLEDLARRRFSGERAELLAAFMRGLYHDVAPADIVSQRPDHLYAAAVSLLHFSENRESSAIVLRVFNPSMEENGWQTSHTVVELVNPDMPFLVDSLSAELAKWGAEIQMIAHPILSVTRDDDGRVLQLRRAEAEDVGSLESFIHMRVRAQHVDRLSELESRLLAIVEDVRAAVEDFPAIRQRCRTLAEELRGSARSNEDEDTEEIGDFLEWLSSRHFIFLGYRYCSFLPREERMSIRPRSDSGLGLLRDAKREVFEAFQLTGPTALLRIFKANERSTVHRPVHLDAVVLADQTASGATECSGGAHMFIGLFTLSAYSRSTENIPLIRRKVDRVLTNSGFIPQSHAGKALRYILETFPRDELFQISNTDLQRISTGILHLHNRHRVALFARRDPFGRFVSCLVYIPRDRMDTQLRLRMQTILTDAYGGTLSAFYTRITDEPFARLHLIVKTVESAIEPDPAALERKLHEATRSWSDRLGAALISELGEESGVDRLRVYASAFSGSYQEHFDELAACTDVAMLDEAQRGGEMTMLLYRVVEQRPFELCLKVYLPSGTVALSDIVPRLENMGLRVVGEVPYEVRPAEAASTLRIHDFSLVTEGEVGIELASVRGAFVRVFSSVSRGVMVDDGFNKLVLHAGLQARQVKLVRAYASFLQQIRSPFSLAYMQSTLKQYPVFVRLLIKLFQVRFNPAWEVEKDSGVLSLSLREELAVHVQQEALAALDEIASLDEDRILRAFLGAVSATLRTNFYQNHVDGTPKEYVSLKIDSRAVAELPEPKPHREIFVFSPDVEGVHLRFGAVARGGLRWSDRREDFRTEVLGLVKAQQVKNAVIVPVGSKGGFVMKNPPPASLGREAFVAAGIECYKTFIRGMLDITDNRVGDEVTHPQGVVVHDGPDPYLVVAADKGTATFSDIANALSVERDFWLADAFASGGSAGYDHKKMGITARGAWESVKRHFRELGKDIQNEPFTACGIGDMSGDVFGNGMLLSKQTKLVAAFNHLHIFIDPDPDPETSWAERRRLFDLPRSSWSDYDRSVLSAGGGVFERRSKHITVTPEIIALLGLSANRVSPNQLMQAILRSDTELIFFGGIGTYVKGATESHLDVGDRANDAIRIDGSELRSKVVGEGANLGMTQKGRVEYSLLGGACYTDFIDNSAGVDCSDHEVNLKILLSGIERAGDMTRKQRNALLADMTDEVATLVLRDNYLQTQALSVTRSLGSRLTDRLSLFMRALERAGKINREIENLPTDEVLAERVRRRIGFALPELSVLLSYAKNSLYADLLSSDLPDEPFLEAELMGYFPQAVRQKFPGCIERHQLRREIIATLVSNDILNRGGIVFVEEAQRAAGASAGDVAKAYIVAREILGIGHLIADIEALDSQLVTDAQASLLVDCGRCLTAMTVWLLKAHGSDLPIAELIELYSSGIGELRQILHEWVPGNYRSQLVLRTQEADLSGIPEQLLEQAGLLTLLGTSGDLVQISLRSGVAIAMVASVYFTVGAELGLDWLRGVARRLPAELTWDRQAVASVVDELSVTQRSLVAAILAGFSGSQAASELVHVWCQKRSVAVERNAQLIADLKSTPVHNFAMLAVASGQMKALLPSARTSPTEGPGSVRSVAGPEGVK